MGLFDTVTCDYALPFPKEAEELKSPPDWSKVEFQTKSMGDSDGILNGFMDNYMIEEDGQIYKDVYERDWATNEKGEEYMKETKGGIEKVNYTGEMVFYASHLEEKYDYWVEFVALFWKGDLKEIKLNNWERIDNSARLEAHEKFTSAVKEQTEIKNSKWYKFVWFANLPLRIFFNIIKFLIGLLVKLVLFLERKLT